MSSLNISNAVVTDMTNSFDQTEVSPMNTDGISDGKETEYTNTKWSEHWGYFNSHPELKSAVLMKAVWDVGKGYTTDPNTQVILDHITGWGKDTFEDILFNMDICRYIGRDSFAEIIRDSETGTLINLKPLDPSSIKIVVDGKGIIKRYEQTSKNGDSKKVVNTFKPQDILHLTNNRIADQIHGISVIESLDPTLLADIESFTDIKNTIHRQVKPFIIFKLKTDDVTKIDALVNKVTTLRNKGEDLFIPDDEDILSYEVVQVNPSAILMQWKEHVTSKFYRALGLPLILFGSAGTTESGGKIEYLAHEQVFKYEQSYIERQIWQQLNLRISLNPPTSLLENLRTDQAKDANQGLEIQPNDVTAGKGK